MIDNAYESNASTLLSVFGVMLVFTFTVFECYPIFVLSSPMPIEEDPYPTLYPTIMPTMAPNNTNDTLVDNGSIGGNIADTALVTGYFFLGMIAIVPLLIGNYGLQHLLQRRIRLVIGLLLSGLYIFIAQTLTVLQTDPLVPFHGGFGVVFLVNAVIICALYLYIAVREILPFGKETFRMKNNKDLVRRLLKPSALRKKFMNTTAKDSFLEQEKQSWLTEIKYFFIDKKLKQRNHGAYEKITDVFFPQRLIYSTLATAFVVFAIGFVVTANLLQIGKYVLPSFWALIWSDGSNKDTLDIIQVVISYVAYMALFPLLILCTIWGLMFRTYRHKLFKLRQGIYEFEPSDVKIYNSSKFIGRQLFLGIMSYFIVSVILVGLVVVIVLCVVFPDFRGKVVSWLIQFVVIFVLTKVITFILDRILLKVLLKNGYLRSHNLFIVYDFISSAIYVIPGFMDSINRLITALKNMVFLYPRMDVPMSSSDLAYNAFLSVLLLDHQYNNPVVKVFLSLLTQDRKLHGDLESKDLAKQPLLFAEAPSVQRNAAFLRARTRWRLAVLLMNNPSLIRMRKHVLKIHLNL